MAVIIDQNKRVMVQGITGREGRARTRLMKEFGTNIVGGCTPGKGGQKIHGVPIFDTVSEAKKYSPINASMIMVPPAGVLSAAIESIENKIPLVVVITEFVPFHDMLVIKRVAQKKGIWVIGPN